MILKPTVVLSLKVGAASAAAGIVLGGLIAHGWYSPRLELAESRVASLAGALETQNKAVDKLGKQTDDLNERLRRAQAAASQRRATQDQKANDLLSIQPPAGEDQCKSASDLIRKTVLGSNK